MAYNKTASFSLTVHRCLEGSMTKHKKKPNLCWFSQCSYGDELVWVLPGGIPLPLAIRKQVYNLLVVRCFHQSFEFRSIIYFLKIVSLVNLFTIEGYSFTFDVDNLIFHPHHVGVELFHHIYESRSFVLAEQMPSLAFDQLLESRNPLVEASLPYEVSML